MTEDYELFDALAKIDDLEKQISALVEALEAVRSGRRALELWVNKYTKCGDESYAHKLSDSALRSFVAEQALALVEANKQEDK